MSVVSARRVGLPPRRGLSRPDPGWWVLALCALAALVLAGISHAHHIHALPQVALLGLASVVLLGVCGDALSVALTPAAWRPVRPLLALAFGTAASGMVLMAFGVAHVPLHVSLWLTLALGLLASYLVRTRSSQLSSRDAVRAGPRYRDRWLRSFRRDVDVGSSAGRGEASGSGLSGRAVWVGVLLLLFLVALIPVWRTADLTIFGENPDASQVVGVAVLFQHVPPTHYDIPLSLDIVPRAWRFRYPIFYPLAAVANLTHTDPIRIFSVLSALLAALTALGWGLCAVRCFRAPAWAGPAVAAMVGFTWIVQYLVWHPYWNQLWGTALMPFTILFGWQAITGGARGRESLRWDGPSAVACLVFLLMLWFAYPLALPYPLVILLGVLVAYWRRPRRPHISSWKGWLAAIIVLCLLAPAVVGSVVKLRQAISQLLSSHSGLWGGDVTHYISFGTFAGTGGGVVAGALVLIGAAYGLWRLHDRRLRICLGVVLAALTLLDLRFRLTPSGTYMDFKHLDFMGLVLISLGASGLLRRAAQPGALRWLAAVAVLVWCGAALHLDRQNAVSQNEQVTPEMFQIRQWAKEIPAGSSVRIDIPQYAGGLALWAVYMLGAHPVDSAEPLVDTTYATPAFGYRADYAISLPTYPGTTIPFPQAPFTGAAVKQNNQFVLRPIHWPARDDTIPQTATPVLDEP